jgi:hypothetical protein
MTLQGPEVAAQQAMKGGQLGGERQRERGGDGVEDKKEETMEGIEEQRAFYTRAKRHEGAMPDRAGLNPKGQRTGTFSTLKVLNRGSLKPN